MGSPRSWLTAVSILVLASPIQAGGVSEADLTDSWRVLSARIFYDAGGGGGMNRGAGHRLDLTADGRWTYGSSSGAFEVRPIEGADWERWNATSYGPTRKIVLSGWKDGEASGPVEASKAGVDFLWVIYRVGPPLVQAPAVVHMKFGRASP